MSNPIAKITLTNSSEISSDLTDHELLWLYNLTGQEVHTRTFQRDPTSYTKRELQMLYQLRALVSKLSVLVEERSGT